MTSSGAFWMRAAISLVLATCVVSLAGHSRERTRSSLDAFPRVMVWAWERREDLRGLDAQRYGIAYLDQTITIGDSITSRARMQPLIVNGVAKLMAVVRIEAPPSATRLDSDDAKRVAEAVLRSAKKPRVAALQIDFDATGSQRKFYSELLAQVRAGMPKEMPLSITALASWCARDDWIASLPVDEAVPMFFRMGEKRAVVAEGWEYPIREPLCMTSAGVSTDEPWPKLKDGGRVYVFHPRAWNEVSLNNLRRKVER